MELDLSKVRRVPPSTLRNVLRSCAMHSGASTEELARACSVGKATVAKALVLLLELQLVDAVGLGWKCRVSTLDRSTADKALDSVFRAALLAYRPFESVCEGLAVGEDFAEAVRHAAVALRLDSRAEQNMHLLGQWAVEFGVLTDGPQGLSLSADLKGAMEAHAALPVASTSSMAETRLYTGALLGRDAFDQLDEIDRSLLITAAMECDVSPASSAEASGQALEDYLRELCRARGLADEAANLSGASQLGSLLRQHGLIHPHHLKLIDVASMLRNSKAHKKDRLTVNPWNITQLGARTAFGATTLAIRSIHEWITNGGQIL